MQKLAALLYDATEMLRKSGSTSPRLDAELIARQVLKIRETELLTQDIVVSGRQVSEFYYLVARRSSGVPMSHILGKREFWGMNFTVNQDVLDPRPDTETLVLTATEIFGNKNRKISVADLGTGTGCLIISILSHYRNAVGAAFEKNVRAYRVAYKNMLLHKVARRIKLWHASWEECHGKFDLIVSNPPYIKRHKIAGLQHEVRFHEPIQALDGGARGMEKYLEIFRVLKRCLKSDGWALLEIGEDQNSIRNEAIDSGLRFHGYRYDLSGRKRCIVLRR